MPSYSSNWAAIFGGIALVLYLRYFFTLPPPFHNMIHFHEFLSPTTSRPKICKFSFFVGHTQASNQSSEAQAFKFNPRQWQWWMLMKSYNPGLDQQRVGFWFPAAKAAKMKAGPILGSKHQVMRFGFKQWYRLFHVRRCIATFSWLIYFIKIYNLLFDFNSASY